MPSRTQRSLSAGEIAPELYGRSDLVQFATGLATCRNAFVLRHGGASNRTGSEYLATVKYSSRPTYLARFWFNDEQTYIIEGGHEYFRFFRNGAVLGAPYEIATPYAADDLATLRFSQSGDVITITHESYQPRELARTGHTSWTLTPIVTAPSIDPPGSLAVAAGGGSAFTYRYQVSAVKADNYDESLPAAAVSATCDQPSVTRPNVLSWSAVAGAVEYNIYCDRGDGNGFGFMGVTQDTTFNDVGYPTDHSYPPPIERLLFTAAGDFPRVSGYYQQRLMFASTTNEPEKVWTSRTGRFKNFTISSPIQDDDAVTWVNAGLRVHTVQHLVEMDRLFVFTVGGIWVPRGDAEETLTPSAIYPKKISPYGAADVPFALTGTSILYAQHRAQRIRALDTNDLSNRDLSVMASHLLKRYSVTRMDFAELPFSILWSVRSDGTLLSLTYLPEHNVIGWGRHDTAGSFEDVCVVPEGNEDAVYVIVRRAGGKFVERFASRQFTNIKTDAIFLDSFLTYDGRNTTDTEVWLTASAWTVDDVVTVKANAAAFTSADVGNAIVLLDADGNEIVRVTITAFTNTKRVSGLPSLTVPGEARGWRTTSWARAVDRVGNANHLAGQTVGILADGSALPQTTASPAGVVDLPGLFMVVHVGLPYTTDLETLDLDLAEAELRDRKKNLKSVSLLVQETRGVFAGPDADHLYEFKPQLANYTSPPELLTELIEIPIASNWRQSGRVLIRQTDPLPLTVLNIIPNGEIGG